MSRRNLDGHVDQSVPFGTTEPVDVSPVTTAPDEATGQNQTRGVRHVARRCLRRDAFRFRPFGDKATESPAGGVRGLTPTSPAHSQPVTRAPRVGLRARVGRPRPRQIP